MRRLLVCAILLFLNSPTLAWSGDSEIHLSCHSSGNTSSGTEGPIYDVQARVLNSQTLLDVEIRRIIGQQSFLIGQAERVGALEPSDSWNRLIDRVAGRRSFFVRYTDPALRIQELMLLIARDLTVRPGEIKHPDLSLVVTQAEGEIKLKCDLKVN